MRVIIRILYLCAVLLLVFTTATSESAVNLLIPMTLDLNTVQYCEPDEMKLSTGDIIYLSHSYYFSEYTPAFFSPPATLLDAVEASFSSLCRILDTDIKTVGTYQIVYSTAKPDNGSYDRAYYQINVIVPEDLNKTVYMYFVDAFSSKIMSIPVCYQTN